MKVQITFDREAFSEFLRSAERLETVEALARSLSKFFDHTPLAEIGIKEEPRNLLFIQIEHTAAKPKEGATLIGAQNIFAMEEAGQLAERLGHKVVLEIDGKTVTCNP